jgi:hypothetical protein
VAEARSCAGGARWRQINGGGGLMGRRGRHRWPARVGRVGGMECQRRKKTGGASGWVSGHSFGLTCDRSTNCNAASTIRSSVVRRCSCDRSPRGIVYCGGRVADSLPSFAGVAD